MWNRRRWCMWSWRWRNSLSERAPFDNVRSHIGSERPEPGPYKCMLTLTSKTRFGVMRGYQEQNREGDLGGSPGFGWTGRPKADNILLMRWGVTDKVNYLALQHLGNTIEKLTLKVVHHNRMRMVRSNILKRRKTPRPLLKITMLLLLFVTMTLNAFIIWVLIMLLHSV